MAFFENPLHASNAVVDAMDIDIVDCLGMMLLGSHPYSDDVYTGLISQPRPGLHRQGIHPAKSCLKKNASTPKKQARCRFSEQEASCIVTGREFYAHGRDRQQWKEDTLCDHKDIAKASMHIQPDCSREEVRLELDTPMLGVSNEGDKEFFRSLMTEAELHVQHEMALQNKLRLQRESQHNKKLRNAPGRVRREDPVLFARCPYYGTY
jgi:hypothetical protein